jgi:hypothetical protein
MFIYLGSQKCGNGYGLCIGDPPKPLETYVVIIIIVCTVIFSIVIGGCACYYRIHQRRQARARFIAQIQAAATQSQSQYIYRINLSPSAAAASSIQETSPPPYEQVARETIEH